MKKTIIYEVGRPIARARAILILRTSLKNWRIYGPWLIAGLSVLGLSWGILIAEFESDKRKAKADGIAKAERC